jgi:histidinol-phosphate aminotransferase
LPLVPPYIESLQPYKAGKPIDEVKREFGLERVVKLASNENPLGPSPKALVALQKNLSDLHLYPNGGYDLRSVLAKQYRLATDNVIVGSGSEGIMSNIIRTFLCDDDEVLTTESAFIGFQVLAKSRGVTYRTVPYRNWHYDLPEISKLINAHTKIIYLANPNNPTGTIFTRDEFDDFYRKVPERVLIILDEAYFEFAVYDAAYPDSMHYRYDNVITLRTFSKAYGLAGIRIGYGFAHDLLIRNLMKVKLPFEPSTLAQAAGIAALGDEAFLQQSIALNSRGLQFLTQELTAMGMSVVPSHANFLMIVLDSADEVTHIFTSLLREGVIVRPLEAFGLPQCLRVSIGTEEENVFFLEKLRKVVKRVAS